MKTTKSTKTFHHHLFLLLLVWTIALTLPRGGRVNAVPATLEFLPPVMPEEYSYSFRETYDALTFNTSTVFAMQRLTGMQYWSLSNQAQRAMVSSGSGVSSTLADPAINRLTVTDFTDPTWDQGSLVVDLIGEKCSYFRNEGETSYQGYDFFRNFVAFAIQNGVPVEQVNDTDWVYDGVSYGPVNIWYATPPTGIEGRVLTYTVVFPAGSNELISYQVNGTEHLPNERNGGMPEFVSVSSVNIRFDYTVMTTPWADGFFDVIGVCPYSTSATTSTTGTTGNPTTTTSTSSTVRHYDYSTLYIWTVTMTMMLFGVPS